ncbi:MAG TPA: DMT family transporter [Sediminispirochaeta sp.]|nr:DMT family transporter [Sediminispirochaeta sp.]
MNVKEWIMLLFLSFIWGGSFFFNRIAVSELPPFTIVAYRLSIGALFLNLFIRMRGLRLPRSIGMWGSFYIMGLVNNAIPFTLIVWGQTSIASGLASILNATTPFFTILIAHLFTSDEKITVNKVIGIVLGFGGVVVIIGADVFSTAQVLPQLAVLGAALSYAVSGVYGRRFRRMQLPSLTAAAGQVTASASLLIPAALLTGRPWEAGASSLPVLGSLVGLGLFSTSIAYIIYFTLLSRAGATNLLLVTFLVPITAILLGTFVLGEQLAANQLVGMVIVFVGLISTNLRRSLFSFSRPVEKV